MRRQALIIGLGQFGMSLARTLADRDIEVLAVDVQDDRVRTASAFAAQAVCFDATDEDALAETSPAERDVCVCAMGDESREASILCTALLRQMGAKRVVGRARDALHSRILRLVGAHVVVNPEEEFGHNFANQLIHREVLGELRLHEGLVITELKPPESFLGRSLMELRLPEQHGILVVGIRERDGKTIELPDKSRPLSSGDVLIVISEEGAVPSMMDLL